MVKSLFNICLAAVSQNNLYKDIAELPDVCKQRLLEFFSSHDQLFDTQCIQLVSSASFGRYLTHLRFYLDDQLSDAILTSIAVHNRILEDIAIIFCQNISDKGIQAITVGQNRLRKLELRALKNLTSNGLQFIHSRFLHSVDLSSCTKITSDGIYRLVRRNRNISSLYLNHCRGLCDQALYDIAHYLGKSLCVLQLDFLPNLTDPGTTLFNLSQKCTNIRHLSLCRFFEVNSLFVKSKKF
ncbi:unnamed protein product [Dracunculus medinensis]|uniref:F-box/LRR-repeat protein 7 n=1 Tax=Dracunculus medinensis TaxID=318479 RepID=A0A0N4ULL6_DRAME|nr:unnamed protein product [Dracunculus medinensis]